MNAPSPRTIEVDPGRFVDELVAELGGERSNLIALLQGIQGRFRYLPAEALRRLCDVTGFSPADVEGVASFYSQFRRQPVGRHVVTVCHGTACHVKGAPLIDDAIRRALNLHGEADTDEKGIFTVQKAGCLGCCTLAPVVRIDGVTYGHLTPDKAPRVLDDFLALSKSGALKARRGEAGVPAGQLGELRIGVGSCCAAGGSLEVRAALEEAVRRSCTPIAVRPVACTGMCHQTPLVEAVPTGRPPKYFAKVAPQDAEGIVRRSFQPQGVGGWARGAWTEALDRLSGDHTWDAPARYALEARDPQICAFLGPQQHIATAYGGSSSPLDLDGYLARGGFEALRKVQTEGDPDAVIATVKASGLRGRGGAGFPTGLKWERVRGAHGSPKYIICNGDEGDPGAFMDRMLLESFPFRVLEGIAIAACAVGAEEGVLYIRAEYPFAVERVAKAIEMCQERGLLGDLRLRIMQGAGAFVCGEETALIASIEGRRGTPTLKPPYPAERGLYGQPTCVNNVETYAIVPWIVREGAEAFARLGTDASKGTKVFALAGKVQRGGLIEVPMGVTIREIVEEIGGGVPEGRTFKGVLIGGPSGGCVPASLADTPIDYEALGEIGAIMGSGGLVVLDDRSCIVDMARFFLEFTQSESCGRCTMCRVGTRRMLDILERICAGHGRHGDLDKLESLAHQVKQGSLCGLGQTAPNPVLTSLRYFREEYEAHLKGKCPAGACKALIHYRVTDACIGCTLCAQACPVGAIAPRPHEKHAVDDKACTRCDTCRRVCPKEAIEVV